MARFSNPIRFGTALDTELPKMAVRLDFSSAESKGKDSRTGSENAAFIPGLVFLRVLGVAAVKMPVQ